MRISTNLIFHTGLNTINTQQSDLLHLYEQIGSGQRMVSPADDPLAAAKSINISQAQALNQRFADNRGVAMRNLATEEDTLSSLTTLLQGVRTRVIQAGNEALSDADRATLADVLAQSKQTMLGLANATDGSGQYLFSGSLGQTAPYQLNTVTNRYEYKGDTRQRNIQADQTRQISGSDIGIDIFNRAQPGTHAYTSIAASSNAGTGVLSSPGVSDTALANLNYGFQISFTSAASYDVTVTDLSTNMVVGTPSSFTYTPGSDTRALDLGHGVQARIQGNPAAGDTFGVRPLALTDVNLFDTLDNLIGALNTPANGNAVARASLRNTLNTALQRLDGSYDNVLTVRASIGTRMNELEALNDNGGQRNLNYAKALSSLEDLDYYDATMKLNLRKMALEGASLAFQTIQGLSLFNMGSK